MKKPLVLKPGNWACIIWDFVFPATTLNLVWVFSSHFWLLDGIFQWFILILFQWYISSNPYRSPDVPRKSIRSSSNFMLGCLAITGPYALVVFLPLHSLRIIFISKYRSYIYIHIFRVCMVLHINISILWRYHIYNRSMAISQHWYIDSLWISLY